jgi:hypothetical protein
LRGCQRKHALKQRSLLKFCVTIYRCFAFGERLADVRRTPNAPLIIAASSAEAARTGISTNLIQNSSLSTGVCTNLSF